MRRRQEIQELPPGREPIAALDISPPSIVSIQDTILTQPAFFASG
jgi:hypothetical protein